MMKRYNNAEMFFEDYKSVADEDKKAIFEALEAEIEIYVDEQGRVWNEGNIYIADVTKVKNNKEDIKMAKDPIYGIDKKEVKYSTCKKGNTSIAVKGEFDEDSAGIFYQHPISGNWVQFPDEIMQGWGEQSQEDQEEWAELINAIEQDQELSQKIYDDMEIIEY